MPKTLSGESSAPPRCSKCGSETYVGWTGSRMCANRQCETRQLSLPMRYEAIIGAWLSMLQEPEQHPVPAERFRTQSLASLHSLGAAAKAGALKSTIAATLSTSWRGKPYKPPFARGSFGSRQRARAAAQSLGGYRVIMLRDICQHIGSK